MFVRKDMRGNWRAGTTVTLQDGYQLDITTHKVASGSLVTSASVGKLEDGFVTHRMYQDFSKRLIITSPKRITSKVVEAQQAEAEADLAMLLQEVEAQYQFNREVA